MTLAVGPLKGCLFCDFVAESCLNKNRREIFYIREPRRASFLQQKPEFPGPGCSSSDPALGGTN